jgi:hypothetical protein
VLLDQDYRYSLVEKVNNDYEPRIMIHHVKVGLVVRAGAFVVSFEVMET